MKKSVHVKTTYCCLKLFLKTKIYSKSVIDTECLHFYPLHNKFTNTWYIE